MQITPMTCEEGRLSPMATQDYSWVFTPFGSSAEPYARHAEALHACIAPNILRATGRVGITESAALRATQLNGSIPARRSCAGRTRGCVRCGAC